MKDRASIKPYNSPCAGIKMVSIFALWVLVSEYGPLLIDKDWGSFIWTTVHFVINPILGVLICLFLVWHALTQKQFTARILSIASICFPIFISYMGFTGSIWFVELLGINFN